MKEQFQSALNTRKGFEDSQVKANLQTYMKRLSDRQSENSALEGKDWRFSSDSLNNKRRFPGVEDVEDFIEGYLRARVREVAFEAMRDCVRDMTAIE